MHEHNTLYLLPNYGSDTNWYRNFLANQTLKISVSGEEIPARGKPITDSSRIRDVMSKFGSKYGDVRKYYPKPDVAVRSRFDKSCRELPISDGDLILNITKRLEANRHAVLL